MEGWDPNTKSTLTQIPLLTTKAGPRDGAAWTTRLKEEYKALIAYTQMNKSNDNDWFRISAANPEGTRWTGKCWYVHNLLKYEFDLQFDIPVTYPSTAPELELPQLDGKTQKMYRGGKICLTVHFKPLWAKNWYVLIKLNQCWVDGLIDLFDIDYCGLRFFVCLLKNYCKLKTNEEIKQYVMLRC
ncbi:hypothetical protein H0E87_004553 [Populus deltoides]|uniref:Ubiquitin-fold modifier-conjugating enzyme 1 n=1 Tax=Populus deltoides TaxID=3696 RepID=A0A8T2ZFX6_POPDE|nr:hypothetical protein H0E87_004553 [Populus deltoides]